MPTYEALPPDLPVPLGDGATDHLSGMSLPDRPLTGTTEQAVNPSMLGGGSIFYVYPMTGRPGVALPDGWDALPGARGCTPETCGFRDLQPTSPCELLSDADFAWADELELPTFSTGGRRFHARLTLMVRDGVIEHVFYPVFPPDAHAAQVVTWLRSNN